MKSLAVKPKAFFPDFGSVSPSDPEHFLYGEKKEFEFRFLPGTVKAGDLLILAVDNDFNFYDPDPSNLTHCAPVMCLGRHEVTAEEAAEQKVEILLETQTADFRDKTNGCVRPLAAKMGLYKWSDESYSLLAIGSAYCHPVLATYDIPLSPIIDDSYYTKEQIDEKVDAKLDKPAVEGQPGQILSLDEDGQNVWKDEQEIPEQEQADWTEDDTTSPAFIRNKPDLSAYAQKSELAPVAISGDYADLSNKPAIPTKTSDLTNDSDYQTGSQVQAALLPYSLVTETGARLSMTVDSNYDLVVSLLDKNGNVLSTQDVDLPIESMVVGASYADGTLTLTLQNGQTLDVDISDIVSGLVPETRTVNGHALSQDVTVTASDLGLATVATTGSYNDLSDQPTLPTQDELVPAATSSDAGKVLTVNASGTPEWDAAQGGGGEDNRDYFCLTAVAADSKVCLMKSGTDMPDLDLEYSTDKRNWTRYAWDGTAGTLIALANAGDRVYFRGDNQTFTQSSSKWYRFWLKGTVNPSGNLMSLIDRTCEAMKIPDTGGRFFYTLFQGEGFSGPDGTLCNPAMTDVSGLRLPATELAEYCYGSMFGSQRRLVNGAVSLPATVMKANCYRGMFTECIALLYPPELPALVLAERCYSIMFRNCDALTKAPKLPAKVLATNCYQEMFMNNMSGQSLLAEVEVGFEDWGSATTNWLSGISTTGVFKCPSALDTTTRDASHIPAGWTVTYTDVEAGKTIPSATASDAGKVLTVGATGTPAWEEAQGGGADQDTLDALDGMISMLETHASSDQLPYFHIFSLVDGNTISLTKQNNWYKTGGTPSLEVSIDKDNWVSFNPQTEFFNVTLGAGDTLWMRGDNTNIADDRFINATGNFKLGGKMTSLLSKTIDTTKTITYMPKFARTRQLVGFMDDFEFPYGVTDIKEAFQSCSGLTMLPPILPSTVSKIFRTFEDCTQVTSLPDGYTIPEACAGVANSLYVTFSGIPFTKVPDGFKIPSGCVTLYYSSFGTFYRNRVTEIGNNVEFLNDETWTDGAFPIYRVTKIGDNFKIRNANVTETDPFVLFPNLTSLGTNCDINGTITNPA